MPAIIKVLIDAYGVGNQSESSILYHVIQMDQSGAEFGCFYKMAAGPPVPREFDNQSAPALVANPPELAYIKDGGMPK